MVEAAKRSRHQIEAEIFEIMEAVAETEGKLSEEQEKKLDILGAERNAKLEASGQVVLRLERDAERWMRMAKQAQAQADWLRGLLLSSMIHAGIDKVGESCVLRTQQNPASCEIVDEKLIPLQYIVTPPPPPPTINKRYVLDALKAGEDVPGARIADVKYHLRIR